MLAALSFIISAVFVFSFWTASVSNNLANVSRTQVVQEITARETITQETVSPKEGIIDALRSLESFVPITAPKEIGIKTGKSIDSFLTKIDLFDVE